MYGLTWRYFFRRKKTFGIAVVMIVLSFLIPLLGVKDYHSFSQMGMIDEAYFLNQQDNLFAQLFVYLLPLLFGFLFGDIWINQRKMGDILTIRADRNKLFFSNWIITLILGFLSVMVFGPHSDLYAHHDQQPGDRHPCKCQLFAGICISYAAAVCLVSGIVHRSACLVAWALHHPRFSLRGNGCVVVLCDRRYDQE